MDRTRTATKTTVKTAGIPTSNTRLCLEYRP